MDEQDDPILSMRDVGKEIWADTNADDYVRDLRANWSDTETAPAANDQSGTPY